MKPVHLFVFLCLFPVLSVYAQEAAPRIKPSDKLPELEKEYQPELFMEDPLDKASGYTLEITEDGKPTENYFPLGLRSGGVPPHIVRMVLHCGFNLWQDMASLLPDPSLWKPIYRRQWCDVVANAHGMLSYTQAKNKSLPPSATKKRITVDMLPYDSPGWGMITPSIKENGERMMFNIFNPAWRKWHMESKKTTARYLGNRAPYGKFTVFWGMENEWEGRLEYSSEAKIAFAKWLKDTYANNLKNLNEAWDGKYSSFEKAAEDAPKINEYKTRPGAFLDWRQFSIKHFAEFMYEAARTLHDNDPQKRPVVYKSTQQTIDMPIVNRSRGIFDHERFADLMRPISGGLYGVNMYGTGDRQAYELNYIYHCIQPLESGNYGVMTPEMNNHNGPGYAWAASYWRLLCNGLKATNFFCPGWKGAKNDYKTFGHIDSATGEPKDKMFYAARWAHMVHRTEALWKNAKPVKGIPKVAILLPKLDVELADKPKENHSKWSYPANNRSRVFRWLRQAGYWVDVIPYNKLAPEYAKRYEAIFLVGAQHLKAEDVSRIKRYVEEGGVLVADERPGYYDEHHRVRNQMDAWMGIKFGEYDPQADYKFTGEYSGMQAKGFTTVTPTTARVLQKTSNGRPLILSSTPGKGRVLYTAFMLGSLWAPEDMRKVESTYVAENQNTADTGEQFIEGENSQFPESKWLFEQLTHVNVTPSYKLTGATQQRVRLEQPYGDKNGNVVISYCTDASRKTEGNADILPQSQTELFVPGGPWTQTLFAPAENAQLQPLSVKSLGNSRYGLSLPPLETAGIIYLLKDHAPLLGICKIKSNKMAVDGHTPQIAPGSTFKVTVQIANASTKTLPRGRLSLLTPNVPRKGWITKPWNFKTDLLKTGEMKMYSFSVTVPTDVENYLSHPDLIPLVARWNDGKQDKAICTTNIEFEK